MPSISGTSVTLESPEISKWFCHFRKIPPSFQSQAKLAKILPKQSHILAIHGCQLGCRWQTVAHHFPLNLRYRGPVARSRTAVLSLRAKLRLPQSDFNLASNRGHQRLLGMGNTAARELRRFWYPKPSGWKITKH